MKKKKNLRKQNVLKIVEKKMNSVIFVWKSRRKRMKCRQQTFGLGNPSAANVYTFRSQFHIQMHLEIVTSNRQKIEKQNT